MAVAVADSSYSHTLCRMSSSRNNRRERGYPSGSAQPSGSGNGSGSGDTIDQRVRILVMDPELENPSQTDENPSTTFKGVHDAEGGWGKAAAADEQCVIIEGDFASVKDFHCEDRAN